ncbi:DUF433 domain-containing protein [Microcoleus sp. herbarium19]|uniref:DUF433 domain-containing protein n=1 Tax=unclassified Microcoleus TaxID=2642155 RepID=UPI002FD66B60
MQLEGYFDFLRPDDIRIRGTRVGIETVLYDFIHRSRTPQEIVEAYPTLSLEQVYATILYYLHDQETVSAYLTQWIEQSRQRREEQKQLAPPTSERLQQLRVERTAMRNKSNAEVFVR